MKGDQLVIYNKDISYKHAQDNSASSLTPENPLPSSQEQATAGQKLKPQATTLRDEQLGKLSALGSAEIR